MEEIRAKGFCLIVGQTQGVVEKIMLPEIQASAMKSREETEQAANQDNANIKENVMYFIDSGDYHGSSNLTMLREPEKAEEEQEIDFSIILEPSMRFTAEVTRREEAEPEFYFE